MYVLAPDYATVQSGISTKPVGLGTEIRQFMAFLGLGLVPTANMTGSSPPEVSFSPPLSQCEHHDHGLDRRPTSFISDARRRFASADCSSWEFHLRLPLELGQWCRSLSA
jgi:hypothetical protein